MPVERTEHRGADELYKYYEVYETIGSGTNSSDVLQLHFGCIFFLEFISLLPHPFKGVSLKSSWVGTS